MIAAAQNRAQRLHNGAVAHHRGQRGAWIADFPGSQRTLQQPTIERRIGLFTPLDRPRSQLGFWGSLGR